MFLNKTLNSNVRCICIYNMGIYNMFKNLEPQELKLKKQ